jgi:hypothetical protein
MPAEPPPDTLSLVQRDPRDMDRDELVSEVRRLRLRLDALREQRDERIAQLQQLEHEHDRRVRALLAGEELELAAEELLPPNVWQQRALAAESQLAALLSTRSMRLLRVPRSVYARLRAGRVGA